MELPRGMKDFDRDEMIKIEFVRQTFLDTAKTFGFDLIEPSPIELLSVLEAKSGHPFVMRYINSKIRAIGR